MERSMFYAMNKLRHSTYLCTPSGKRNNAIALLLLSLSILRIFPYPIKSKAVKNLVFYSLKILLFKSCGFAEDSSCILGSYLSVLVVVNNGNCNIELFKSFKPRRKS